MLSFYHIGFVFNRYKIYEQRIPVWESCLLLVLYTLIIAEVEPAVNIKENVFPYYLFILSLVPIYALYQLCCKMQSKFLIMCGVSSLTVMGLHHPIFDVIMFPLMSRLSLPHFCESLLMVLITLIIVLFIDKMINKYVPFLLGKF